MQSFKNAHQQDVEEILASIRSSIAEESGAIAPREPLSGGNAAPARDEHGEFELPAMFKQQSLTQALGELRPRSGPLPRLRDELAQLASAVVSEAPSNVTSINVARRNDAAARQPATGFSTLRMGHHFDARPPAAADSLPITLVGAPAPEPITPPPASVAASETDPTVPRQMASFMDTKMSRMNAMSRPLTAPAPQPFVPPFAGAAVNAVPAPAKPSMPPPVPEGGAAGTEDIAAQLLRPMLKAWLTENMPKIVEKALRSEAGD